MRTSISRHIFHEKQQEALCAVHCINNLLQGNYITAVDLAQIAQVLDEKEEKMLLQNGRDSSDYKEYLKRGKTNVSLSGDFSVQVVGEALKIYNLKMDWIMAHNDDTKNAQHDPLFDAVLFTFRSEQAYICNLHSHWFPLRKFQGIWYKIDSTKSEPECLSDLYLTMFLKQLQVEGYQIFVVSGNLPECRADLVIVEDEDDELQQAIKLSLGQGKSKELTEEEYLERAIQESLKTSLQPVKKSDTYPKDFDKWLNPKENGYRIQIKFPDGSRQVVQISKFASMSALYGFAQTVLNEKDKTKRFYLHTHQKRLPSDSNMTLENLHLNGVAISMDFE
jgi:ataxin-3